MHRTLNYGTHLIDLNLEPCEEDNAETREGYLLDLNLEPCEEEADGAYLPNLEPREEEADDAHLPDLNLNPPEDTHLEEQLHPENRENHNSNAKKNLSNAERRDIYSILLQKSVDGKLNRWVTTEVASIFSVNIRTVQRIWKQGRNSSTGDVSSRKPSNCGRKRVQVDCERIREIPLHERSTIESLASSLKISKTKTFYLFKSGSIRRHSNAIKPFLKEENKVSRLHHCISMLEESSLPHDPTFKSMYNVVHIDEKWFYMTKKSENYYLLPDEEDPIRSVKSKNFIEKIMFLVAIARPRFDAEGNETFSGKIGVFPFITQEPAKRSSVNRAAGTLETKAIPSIGRDISRSYLIEKVLPAIKEKWPRSDIMHPIFIQQDNARTHIDPTDIEFCEAARQDGFDIRLVCQPPNSPDLNVLDLGFFSAIQSLKNKESPKTVDELVSAVTKSFENFSTVKSNRIFLTLQLCMIEIMKARGCHKYKIPHINKAKMEIEGKLPIQLRCDPTLVQEVIHILN